MSILCAYPICKIIFHYISDEERFYYIEDVLQADRDTLSCPIIALWKKWALIKKKEELLIQSQIVQLSILLKFYSLPCRAFIIGWRQILLSSEAIFYPGRSRALPFRNYLMRGQKKFDYLWKCQVMQQSDPELGYEADDEYESEVEEENERVEDEAEETFFNDMFAYSNEDDSEDEPACKKLKI